MEIKGKPIFERKIRDMKIGETGYTVPWALIFDENKVPHLNLDMTIEKSPKGTISLPLKRTGPGNADYTIDLNFSYFGEKYKWATSDMDFDEEGMRIIQLGDNPISIKRKTPELSEGKGISILEREIMAYKRNKYPLTYNLRNFLDTALEKQDYEEAARLRDEINATPEPLQDNIRFFERH